MNRQWGRAGVLGAFLSAGLLAATMNAAPAAADDGPIAPVDSHGIPITDYVLSFNEGAGVFGVAVTPEVSIPASFASLMFGLFIAMAWLSFSVLNLFLRLDWLTPLVREAESISTSISNQLGQSFVFYIIGGTMLLTVVVFALRNQSTRAWHHIAITLVCMGVGVVIALPVGEAAHLLKTGRDIAVETGGAVTGQAGTTNATTILVDKFVREPTQRWQFGHDLDSLGCGNAWDAKIRAHDPDKVKDASLSCPGGQGLHSFAMHPAGAIWLGFLYPVFMLLVTGLILLVVVMIAGTAVSAIIHAALIKPGLIAVGTPSGQSFLARNVIDGFTAALHTCGLLLMLFVSAALAGLFASTVGSSEAGMLITIVVMVATIIGARKAGRSMRTWKGRAASMLLPDGAPNAYGPPSKAPQQARRMAMATARQVAAKRSSNAVVRAIKEKGAATAAADAVAPEVMIPAQAMGIVAHHIMHAAHHYAAQNNPAAAGASASAAAAVAATAGNRRAAQPASTRSVNYGGSPTGGGSAATARDLARRSSQRRAPNNPSPSGPTPGGGGRSAAPTPARPAARLRTSSGRLGPSSSPAASRAPRVPAAAGVSPPLAASAAPSSADQPRAPSASMRRSGAINTARDTARDYRNRRS